MVELLALDRCRGGDPDYAGYGWAKVDRIWLQSTFWRQRLDDVLLVVVHAADAGKPIDRDVELDFEVGEPPGLIVAGADASAFLAQWFPRLPAA